MSCGWDSPATWGVTKERFLTYMEVKLNLPHLSHQDETTMGKIGEEVPP